MALDASQLTSTANTLTMMEHALRVGKVSTVRWLASASKIRTTVKLQMQMENVQNVIVNITYKMAYAIHSHQFLQTV